MHLIVSGYLVGRRVERKKTEQIMTNMHVVLIDYKTHCLCYRSNTMTRLGRIHVYTHECYGSRTRAAISDVSAHQRDVLLWPLSCLVLLPVCGPL